MGDLFRKNTTVSKLEKAKRAFGYWKKRIGREAAALKVYREYEVDILKYKHD